MAIQYGKIFHAQFDGTWHPHVLVPGQFTKSAPAVAAVGDQLDMVHTGLDSNHLWHSMFDAGAGEWSENVAIPGQLSQASPALAALRGQLHMVHLGDGSSATWTSPRDLVDHASTATPGLAAAGGALHMLYTA